MSTRLDELARHEEAIERARALERQREDELRERTRSLTALRAQRMDYERAVGGGRERDDNLEQRFAAELNDLDVVEADRGVIIDRRARARAEGAVAGREQAQQQRDAFCSAHAEALLSELAQQGDPEEIQGIAAHLGELDRLLRARTERVRRAHAILTRAGRLPDDILGDDPLDNLAYEAQRLRHRAVASMVALPEPADRDAAA